MASNRHLGRIISLQSLYEHEFRIKAGDATADINSIIAKNILPYEKAIGDTEFVYDLTRGVESHSRELDAALKPLAPEWPIESIAAIDRNVLRIGLYELQLKQVPPKVAINEAVELAKAFGSENSSRFINGVLGTAFRQLGLGEDSEDAEGKHEPAKSKKKAHKEPATQSQSAPESASTEQNTPSEAESDPAAEPKELSQPQEPTSQS